MKTYPFYRIWLTLLVALWVVVAPARALVKMDKQSVDLALKYGMQNAGMGYSTLLGGNWLEGPDGMLLNIYTPFMMLASKAYQGGFSREPDEAEVKKARGRYGRLITTYTDPKNRTEIKFAVSMYGDDPAFATRYRGWIEGFGRGRDFKVSPVRVLYQKEAHKDTEASQKPYEAVNSYYFNFDDVSVLDDYRFILETPDGERAVFKIRNDKIY